MQQFPGRSYNMPISIELNVVPDPDALRPAASQDDLDTANEFGGAEGLRDVVVRPKIEAAYYGFAEGRHALTESRA